MQLCFFPTTVVFVDDNQRYLDVLYDMFAEIPVLKRRMANLDISKYLNEYKSPVKFSKFEMKKRLAEANKFNVVPNLAKLHRILYERKRFHTISTLVVDYLMPGKIGTEILEEVKDVDIKKIFLTSFLNHDEAIELINRDLVHQCFNKYDGEFIIDAERTLVEVINKFFEDKVKFEYTEVSFMQNPFLCKLINGYIDSKKPVEYYVLDDKGSYLFLDGNAKPSGIFVRSEEDMCKFYDRLCRSSAPASLLYQVLERKMMFGGMYSSLSKREKCVIHDDYFIKCAVPANIISDTVNGGNLYYAFVDTEYAFPLDWSKVTSFNSFKSKM